MISQEVKTKIKSYLNKSATTFAEMRVKEELRTSMRFTDEADLEFDIIDFFYNGVPNMIIKDARERAERLSFSHGYERAIVYLSDYVGWYALISKDLQPALRTSKAYDVVTDKLIKECWAGARKGARNVVSD